jgi:DNA-directed RNA polymerase specialized sigma24 family protein
VPKNLREARQELEQLVLLEAAAENREERIRAFLRRLVSDFGFEPQELARRLDISLSSVESLVSDDTASPVAERLDLSEATVERLLQE